MHSTLVKARNIMADDRMEKFITLLTKYTVLTCIVQNTYSPGSPAIHLIRDKLYKLLMVLIKVGSLYPCFGLKLHF